uniref:C2H2-type domain-containing protein n=1 Tax=Pundamilia nyererei TaxID=303518 RepID=A0A3B4HAZ0_9CICH
MYYLTSLDPYWSYWSNGELNSTVGCPTASGSRCNSAKCKKSLKCDVCGKTFDSHLTEHIMTHTGEKCCSCPTCGKMFAYNRDLLKHSRSHTGEKPYHCKTCGKVFGYSSSLFKHMRVHAGLKPSHKTWKNIQK